MSTLSLIRTKQTKPSEWNDQNSPRLRHSLRCQRRCPWRKPTHTEKTWSLSCCCCYFAAAKYFSCITHPTMTQPMCNFAFKFIVRTHTYPCPPTLSAKKASLQVSSCVTLTGNTVTGYSWWMHMCFWYLFLSQLFLSLVVACAKSFAQCVRVCESGFPRSLHFPTVIPLFHQLRTHYKCLCAPHLKH